MHIKTGIPFLVKIISLTPLFVEGVEPRTDFLHAPAVDAKIGIADAGCRTHMDRPCPGVKQKLHVVHEAEKVTLAPS
jgi:hypothetical protein